MSSITPHVSALNNFVYLNEILKPTRIFTSPYRKGRLWGPPSLLSNGYWGFFPRGWEAKWQGRESDHSLQINDDVKEIWIYKSTPPYFFMAKYLISYALG
jgi:hypothetical protein